MEKIAASTTRFAAFAKSQFDRHTLFMSEHQTANAGRLRAFRERRKRNAAILAVEVEPARLTAALKTRGILQPNETPSRVELADHVAAVVSLWCNEPLSEK